MAMLVPIVLFILLLIVTDILGRVGIESMKSTRDEANKQK